LWKVGRCRILLQSSVMILHSLSVAVRGLLRSKATALVNILGLSSALTVAMVILLWCQDEMGVDRFHKQEDRLYQVVSNVETNGNILTRDATPIGLATVLREEMPGLEHASIVTPLNWFPKFVLKTEGLKIKAEGKFVSREFFNMFTYPVIKGEPLFHTKESAIVTESIAIKLFGSVDKAIGETIDWEITDIKRSSTITAVCRNIPSNSTDQFEIVLSIDMLRDIMGFAANDLNAFGPQTFVTLNKNGDVE
jgi:putative ABC transport system permease protein